MVDISNRAQTLLNGYIDRYVDYRRRGEYGTSPFWNWYYQVRNYIYQLDSEDSPIGDGLSYTMPNWGEIKFSRNIIGGEVYVLVTNLIVNRTNFFNWIRYNRLPMRTPITSPTKSITSWDFADGYESYNDIHVVVSNNEMYSLANKDKSLVINDWFDNITFPKLEKIEGVSTIGEGDKSNIKYLISTNLEVIHPAKIAIMNRRVINNAVSRAIDNLINEIIEDDRQRKIRRIVRESIDRFINQIVA
ncbi:MAG: hypothetical protein J6U14_02410 [Bacteroidaceae bacterium]|nr:hypothetical protein [Bacteroidaceae bacterium]